MQEREIMKEIMDNGPVQGRRDKTHVQAQIDTHTSTHTHPCRQTYIQSDPFRGVVMRIQSWHYLWSQRHGYDT